MTLSEFKAWLEGFEAEQDALAEERAWAQLVREAHARLGLDASVDH